MLKSYEAIYENGQMKWLKEQPSIQSARVIVTILEETELPVERRSPPDSIAGKGKTLGNVVSPILDEEDKTNISNEYSRDALSLLSIGGSQPSLQPIPRRRPND